MNTARSAGSRKRFSALSACITIEQTRFADAVSAHNAARSVAMATPNGEVVASVSAILEKEQNNANLHGAALAKADGKVMEEAYSVLGIVPSSNDDIHGVGGEHEYPPEINALLLRSNISGNPSPEALEAATTVSQKALRQLYTQVLAWIPSSMEIIDVEGTPFAHGSSVAGRIMGGAAREMWASSSASVRWNIAFTMQVLTDIPAQKIMETVEGVGAATEFVDRLQNLMRDAQYGHILEGGTFGGGIVMASLNKTRYENPLETIRIRFDLSTTVQDIRAVTAYVGGKAVATSAAGTFIHIPASAFEGFSSQNVVLGVTLKNGKSLTPKKVGVVEIAFAKVVERTQRSLPVSDAMLQDPVHKKIVNSMVFPVQGNGWSYGIYSSAHAGAASYALDLNHINDDKADIFAPASGKVEKIDLKKGEVTIRSIVEDGTAQWRTTVLHMDHIFSDLGSEFEYEGIGEFIKRTEMAENMLGHAFNAKGMDLIYDQLKDHQDLAPVVARIDAVQAMMDAKVTEGLFVTAGVTKIGQGGNEGHSQGAHIHIHAKDADNRAIPLFGMANTYQPEIGVQIVRSEESKINTRYDAQSGLFVYDAERILISRTSTGDTHFFAHNEDGTQGEEVRWEEVQYPGEPEARFRWVSVADNFREWKKTEIETNLCSFSY